MSNFYFIDFENLQNLDYDSINKDTDQIVIFAGQNQSKISIEIIKKTQPLGKAVEWIQMEGSGRNSLDFHIAFYLGYFIALQESLCKKTKVHVLSKDADYDNLIKHIQSLGYACERIEVISKEIKTTPTHQNKTTETTDKSIVVGNSVDDQIARLIKSSSPTSETIEKIVPPTSKPTLDSQQTDPYNSFVEKLTKLEKPKRPRKKETLSNYITSYYRGIKTKVDSQLILNRLTKQKIIALSGEKISYLA